MKFKITGLIYFTLLVIGLYAYTHPGRLDLWGGHYETGGEYHYHQGEALPGEYPDIDFSEKEIYQVVRVVDGDTIILRYNSKNETVRLIGVDTPETVHPYKPVEPYGPEASQFLKNLLKGEKVYITFGENERDRYGRLLGYLFRSPDLLFVNLEIIRQGYGEAYTRFPFKYQKVFTFYNTRAKNIRKGLHGAN